MRLIDAAAMLMDAVRISGPDTGDGWSNWGVYALIERQPAIDAVPVVRCRECAYCHEEMPNALWCQGRGSPYQLVPHDGYCDRGRRRDTP